ncbi:MAG: hypothetical protein ACK559_19955, partial [bacterium]
SPRRVFVPERRQQRRLSCACFAKQCGGRRNIAVDPRTELIMLGTRDALAVWERRRPVKQVAGRGLERLADGRHSLELAERHKAK